MYTSIEDYRQQLEAYCKEQYGLEADYVIGHDHVIEQAYKAGETHTELADYYGEKRGLIPRSQFTLDRARRVANQFNDLLN